MALLWYSKGFLLSCNAIDKITYGFTLEGRRFTIQGHKRTWSLFTHFLLNACPLTNQAQIKQPGQLEEQLFGLVERAMSDDGGLGLMQFWDSLDSRQRHALLSIRKVGCTTVCATRVNPSTCRASVAGALPPLLYWQSSTRHV